MSSYYDGESKIEYRVDKGRSILLGSMIDSPASPDLQLSQKAKQLCKVEGINYKSLEPIQRLFLTHYRCPMCKLLPLYYLDLAHPKRVRCGCSRQEGSPVYRNSIDAFTHLVSKERDSVFRGMASVIQISAKMGYMQNGIRYCSVQVTFTNGEEYRIDAYGEEADELYSKAREKSAVSCLH